MFSQTFRGVVVMTHAFLHPFSAPTKPESEFINIVRGEGSTLWDDKGKSYIDGLASLWLCQAGHGQREIVDAVHDQMLKLSTYNTFDPFTNSVAAEVAEMIVERSPFPDGRVFLGCSGSEAVDTSLKLSRLVGQLTSKGGRQIILRRTGGYHGVNFGGTSAQGIESNRVGWGDLLPHFIEVSGDDIEDASRVFAEHGENVAAVICEPVQGAGGVNIAPDGYLSGLRRLCDQNGALLIFDEVIAGFGRTGSWFGAQTLGVTPDLITFAKGVTSGYQPLSGVIVSKAVCDLLAAEVPKLMHGYTYSGHPACAAAGIANINILERDGLVERAKHIGDVLGGGLAALAADGVIEDYRGLAGVWAAEIGTDAVPVRDKMLELGVIARPIGQVIAFCPPLVISDEEVTTMLDTLVSALEVTT